ncbi:serine/threonine protein kinase [Colletotrichum graminicola]|uniref:Serine/threonine protein kinase n=1 Tax=Colletotrichum graminicola (strain M1.001 / M2 / FGSC 10212) TaxID=645133 RepID=E3R0B8_COLGM|nr:serine/threonine protein kinase [Colletotrichum graminicola M1.001]EFQ36556.1 serine/threonine protein kinase [Colletotrichum graminicola M1.001]WDK23719.1 serine/threonine protein kinase [Colletotrichum graminicola]
MESNAAPQDRSCPVADEIAATRTSMPLLLSINQVLKGRKSTYTIVKELYRAADEGAVYLARDHNKSKCIVKSIRGHWRLQNEANVLERYQSKTPFLRPIIDKVIEPTDPPSIILRHLDSELLTESKKKRLTRPEIKQVARCILEALLILHKDGMVHTDLKLDNAFVNYGQNNQRFSEIQLGDCGGVVSKDSKFAREGHAIGATFTRSPEALLQLSWGTPTDVWSFGNIILSLVHGGGYHHFDPGWEGIKPEDEDYEITVLKRMYNSFGPFPPSIADILDSETFEIIHFLNQKGPPQRPLQRWSTKEIPVADNDFIRRILKLDPRDRPTVEEILKDEWFIEESDDTRELIPEGANSSGDGVGS